MKSRAKSTRLACQVRAWAVSALLLVVGCGEKPDTAAPAAKKTGRSAPDNAASAAPALTNAMQSLAVRSVFSTEQAPDPFFPKLQKKQGQAAAPGKTNTQVAASSPASALRVKQILAAGDKRVALVNDAVLEAGRAANVTIASGQRWRVFCVAVGLDSVTVRVEGQGDREVTLPAPGRSSR